MIDECKIKWRPRLELSCRRQAVLAPTGVFGAEESPRPFDKLTAVIVTRVGLPVALSCIFLYFRGKAE